MTANEKVAQRKLSMVELAAMQPPQMVAKKLIRFQLPADPTDAEIDDLVAWIRGSK